MSRHRKPHEHIPRARQDDPTRQTITEEDRPLVQEIVREVEARLPKAVTAMLREAGIMNADTHRQQHESMGDLLPKLSKIVPYVEADIQLKQKGVELRQKIIESVVDKAVLGGLLLIILSLYFGGMAAIKHIIGESAPASVEVPKP